MKIARLLVVPPSAHACTGGILVSTAAGLTRQKGVMADATHDSRFDGLPLRRWC